MITDWKMRACLTFALLLTLLVPPHAACEDVDRPSLVNGFLSQGYIRSSRNNFLLETSRDGSTQLSEAAVAINRRISDRFRIGMQFLARDLGSEGNSEAGLDWGYGEYRVSNLLGVRLGKVKLPMGLYNEERDSDFLRPTAFLPQSIYDEMSRDFLSAALGAGIFGNLLLGSRGGLLNYSLFAGEINVDEEINLVRLQLPYISTKVQADLSAMAGTTVPPVTELRFESDPAVAARLSYHPPLGGLRLAVSYLDVGGFFKAYTGATPYQDVLDSLGASFVPGTVDVGYEGMKIFSLEYLAERLELRAEYMTFNLTSTIFGSLQDDLNPEGWYAMATFQVPGTEKLWVTAAWDVYYRDGDDRAGTRYPGPAYYTWRKDTGLGFRYDVDENFALKAEVHRVDGLGSTYDIMRLLNEGIDDGYTSARDWSYFVFKGSYNF